MGNAYPVASSVTALMTMALIISMFPASINSQNDDTSYEDCSPFKCGNLNFSFPFSSSLTSGYCGLPDYQITCDAASSSAPTPRLLLSGRLYQITNFLSYQDDRLITVVDTQLIADLSSGSCESLSNLSVPINNYSYPVGSLTLPPGASNFTFFKCPNGLSLPEEFTRNVVSNVSCDDGHGLYLWNGTEFENPSVDPVSAPSGCDSVLVPVSSVKSLSLNGSIADVFDALKQGFQMEWPKLDDCERCQNRSGRCGYNGSLKKIVCFCKGGSCDDSVKKSQLPVIVGAATGSCTIGIIAALLLVFRKRISSFSRKILFEDHQNYGDGLNVKRFIETYRSALLSNYSYNDIKKITNGFKEKLGAGGCGSVYKGQFPDGRLVAVKLLEKVSNFSDNFINEVATIGRIHHVNIITLLGFCCDGSTRALIYEYMPNGSIADLLSNENVTLSVNPAKLLEIAIGVAHAIEYLHIGCELRILHLDIKPQNVLLDLNLNPKVSDFGLAKWHSRSRSVVTMTGPRGTIGYIAPEIFLRSLGNPSHKSDVYSYGMLLLEMVGGKKHFKPTETTGGSSTTEAYFPEWLYDKLIQQEKSEVEEEEECISRKMITVGLWCIQINPKGRPSMTRVVEMLTASREAIEMPPKPFFPSTPSQAQSEIICFNSNIRDFSLHTQNNSISFGSNMSDLTLQNES